VTAVVVNGKTIWCHERGNGRRALILLHPGPGSDGSVFFPWFDRLASEYTIIAPDLPGHGRSEAGDVSRWNLKGYAATVSDLARARGLSDYILLGHSFGSWIALTHAIQYPGAAACIIASCGAAWLEGDVLRGLAARMKSIEPEALRRDIISAFEAESRVQSAPRYRDLWLRQAPFFVADPVGHAADELRQAFARVTYRPKVAGREDWGTFDVREGLPRVKVPVLAITGARDRSTPPDAGRHIARLAPRGTFIEVPNAGHFPYLENPEFYFQALSAWLLACSEQR
jgi:pimeloyl-ACP methyl ester carboxylesterase